MKIKFTFAFLAFVFFGCGSSSISCNSSADPVTGMEPLGVQFTEAASGELVYTWDFGDSTPTSSSSDPFHTYQDDGIYFAVLVVANLNSTAACEPIMITVDSNK